MANKQQIRKLVWDMACSAADNNVTPFFTDEYEQLIKLGWAGFVKYKQGGEWMARMSKEELILFTFVIYYGFYTR